MKKEKKVNVSRTNNNGNVQIPRPEIQTQNQSCLLKIPDKNKQTNQQRNTRKKWKVSDHFEQTFDSQEPVEVTLPGTQMLADGLINYSSNKDH